MSSDKYHFCVKTRRIAWELILCEGCCRGRGKIKGIESEQLDLDVGVAVGLCTEVKFDATARFPGP